MNTANITTTELLAILDVTRRLAEQRMVQPLIEYVGTTVFELIPAETCLILLFDKDDEIVTPFARNRNGNQVPNPLNQVSHSILERVRATLSPLVVSDAQNQENFRSSQSIRILGLRSVMCVPLVSYGQAVGAIYLENRSARGRFREESLLPLVLFSNQVVVALENARIYEALEARIAERTQELQQANRQLAEQAKALREQSIRDSLTGLHNRRYFNEILPLLFERAHQKQMPLTLACLDIDHFKQINDSVFHTGGDQVLRSFAEVLQQHIRETDSIARIGGEEFALLLPNTDLQQAIQLCERLRQRIANHDWQTIAPNLKVTVSIGLAEAGSYQSAQELLHHADTRLYIAKRLGRNQVVAAE